MPQRAVQMLHEETRGKAIITTGVGQHQMWSAHFYPFQNPRHWVTSGGLGSMGFGLPSALGAALAFDGKNGREKKVVVDIDGDGSFLMNNHELAVAFTKNVDLKVFILNNQYLGMVLQREDQFYDGNRVNSFLGREDSVFHETKVEANVYPDFVKLAAAFGVPADRVMDPKKLRKAIRKMLDTPGPYLLDVMMPHLQHVLPMVPPGGSFENTLISQNGSNSLHNG